MKVLLTGASGFVGSHILDALRARDVPVALLLRTSSDKRFLSQHLSKVESRTGSINDLESLNTALGGISHIIHCAGCTKARKNAEFYIINQLGTRNVVTAANARGGQIERLVHISSLAVTGPATPDKPARENDRPNPISSYGKSKALAESELRDKCEVPFTILRPPAVYGPRDNGFFPMFQAVSRHILPRPSATQMLSLVFAEDLARGIVEALLDPMAAGRTYFISSAEIVSGRQMADEIAAKMGHWTAPLPMPPALLWPVCLAQEVFSHLTGKPMLLNLQKYAELRAPGWVCDPSLLKSDLNFECQTSLKEGVATTLDWYRQHEWL